MFLQRKLRFYWVHLCCTHEGKKISVNSTATTGKKKITLQFSPYRLRQLSTSCSPALYGTQKGTGRVKPCTLHLTDVFVPPPMQKCMSCKPRDMTLLWTRLQHERLQIVPCICRRCRFPLCFMTDVSVNRFSFRVAHQRLPLPLRTLSSAPWAQVIIHGAADSVLQSIIILSSFWLKQRLESTHLLNSEQGASHHAGLAHTHTRTLEFTQHVTLLSDPWNNNTL